MRKHWKKLVLVLVVIYLVGVGVVAFRHMQKPPKFFSSATLSRSGKAFQSGYLGVLKPGKKSADQNWPAGTEMAIPVRIPGDSQDTILDWKGEQEMRKELPPSRWAGGLEGDDDIELIAFASWTPQPDDDVSEGADWKAEAVFRDPKTLQELTVDDLDALGVPEEFRTLTPPKRYRMPKLRLLFRSETMEYVRILDGKAGDERTGAVVTYRLDRLNEDEPMFASEGAWTRVDLALLVWHDTPLKIQLSLLTGEPEFAELAPELGAQVAFGDWLRLQWLQRFDGDIDLDRYSGSFTPASSISADLKERLDGRLDQFENHDPYFALIRREPPDADPEPGILVRSSSKDFLIEHCGWIRPDEKNVQWNWDRTGENGQILLATTEGELKPGQPMKLVFLPLATELTFELAGLPDQPNPGDVDDLFEVKIPRLTLPDDPDSAEDHLLGTVGVATEVDFDIENLWEEMPPALPGDRTFRNQSPRELLTWYLRNTPGARIRYEEPEYQIYYNEDKGTWWERFQEWMEDQGWFL